MSAEKCGEPITAAMLDEAIKKALEPRERPIPILSPQAYKLYGRIKKTYPKWEPDGSADVWYKAYKMGLLEDE